MTPLKFIAEYTDPTAVQFLKESTGDGTQYFIQGIFLQAEIKNRNERIYPIALLEAQVNRYQGEFIARKRAFGELGHPTTPSINLDRVSHMIQSLVKDGNNFIGKAKILDTPNGRIVKALMDEGATLGVSSRGAGNLRYTANGYMVCDDFVLATAADIVADPSAPDSFVRGIMEEKSWIFDNGIFREAEAADLKKVVAESFSKKPSARPEIWMEAFSTFLHRVGHD
jgi:hypothetical protein